MQYVRRLYSDAEKLEIVKSFLASGETMDVFQSKNGMGHCTLSRWMTKFGFLNDTKDQSAMDKSQEKSANEITLEAKIIQLEKELEHAKLQSLAYKTMIEVAEEELGIDIRKKSGAKQ